MRLSCVICLISAAMSNLHNESTDMPDWAVSLTLALGPEMANSIPRPALFTIAAAHDEIRKLEYAQGHSLDLDTITDIIDKHITLLQYRVIERMSPWTTPGEYQAIDKERNERYVEFDCNSCAMSYIVAPQIRVFPRRAHAAGKQAHGNRRFYLQQVACLQRSQPDNVLIHYL